MRVEEHDGLDTRELRVVHLDVAERRDQLVHDANANLPDDVVLNHGKKYSGNISFATKFRDKKVLDIL